jgi:hypothetical protein
VLLRIFSRNSSSGRVFAISPPNRIDVLDRLHDPMFS